LGVHGQSKASQATGSKPRIEVKGHPDFAAYYKQLKTSKNAQDDYLLKLIDDTIDQIGQRRTVGNSVQRDRWPREYRALKIPCLFRVDLDANYRMTYSLIKTQNKPLFAWIIEVMAHKVYNQRFGYK
jgi:hypothetical protein